MLHRKTQFKLSVSPYLKQIESDFYFKKCFQMLQQPEDFWDIFAHTICDVINALAPCHS